MRRGVGAVVTVLALAAGAAACGGGDDGGESSDSSTTSSSDTSTTTGDGTTTTSGDTGATTTTSASTSAAPVISTFTAAPVPVNCSASSDLTLTWATQGATGVDLSIDGPGVYGSYGPSGSATVTFPCDGGTHSYLLTARGAGGEATRTITVSQLPIPM